MTETELPHISVVIPVRNEETFIGRNLEAVIAQDYPSSRLEVLVADGHSGDTTRDIVRRAAERVALAGTGARIVLIDNPGLIMATGANAAIRQATGDVIVLLSGHAELPPHYLRSCVTTLLARGADAASGSLESVGTGLVGEAIAAAMSSRYGIGNSGFRILTSGEPFEVDTIPFGAYRRGVFERVGLFNPNMVRHQDYEFNYRLRQSGGRTLLIPGLKAVYHVRSNLPALWQQYWQYGIWKGRFLRRFPRSLRVRHLLPPVFALLLVASAAGALAAKPLLVMLGLLLGAYLGFVCVGLVSFAARGHRRILAVLPLVMAYLHIGYGLGVWVGLALPRVPEAPRSCASSARPASCEAPSPRAGPDSSDQA